MIVKKVDYLSIALPVFSMLSLTAVLTVFKEGIIQLTFLSLIFIINAILIFRKKLNCKKEGESMVKRLPFLFWLQIFTILVLLLTIFFIKMNNF